MFSTLDVKQIFDHRDSNRACIRVLLTWYLAFYFFDKGYMEIARIRKISMQSFFCYMRSIDCLICSKSDIRNCMECIQEIFLQLSNHVGRHQLECDISSKDGIMIASWNGFHDNNDKDPIPDNTPLEQLSKLTKERVNLGAVTSEVIVDGKSVGKVDEITSMNNNVLNYKINAMNNFTEIYAKPFNITIPENTFLPDQVVGTWPSGAHGWFLFLKPLPPGDHKVSYNLSVQGLGADNVSSETTYTFHVK